MTPRSRRILAALAAVATLAAHQVRAADLTALVVAVHDGDTLTVQTPQARLRVRVAAIDAPELDQPYGDQAHALTEALTDHQVVTLRTIDTDRYGRVVAFVFLSDGRMLERELLAAGLAWQYRFFSADAGLRSLEEEARAAHRGLWAALYPIAPWEWRRSHRSEQP